MSFGDLCTGKPYYIGYAIGYARGFAETVAKTIVETYQEYNKYTSSETAERIKENVEKSVLRYVALCKKTKGIMVDDDGNIVDDRGKPELTDEEKEEFQKLSLLWDPYTKQLFPVLTKLYIKCNELSYPENSIIHID